jgi:hypothetical protein
MLHILKWDWVELLLLSPPPTLTLHEVGPNSGCESPKLKGGGYLKVNLNGGTTGKSGYLG